MFLSLQPTGLLLPGKDQTFFTFLTFISKIPNSIHTMTNQNNLVSFEAEWIEKNSNHLLKIKSI